MSEDNVANESSERMVSRRRQVFDVVIGASVPVVLSLSIGILNRINSLESYRDLDEYRLEQLYVWRDHGAYSRHQADNLALANSVNELARRSQVCEIKVAALESALGARQLPQPHTHPRDKSNGSE